MPIKKLVLTVCLVVSGVGMPAFANADQAQELAQMQAFLGIMERYFALIHNIESITSDADKAAIWQLQKIDEIHKERGERGKSIRHLRSVLERSKSATVRNAAASMLADALNETGDSAEAIEVLKAQLERNIQ